MCVDADLFHSLLTFIPFNQSISSVAINKKPRNSSGLSEYFINKVMTLQNPGRVCMPPPLNIIDCFVHCSANMREKDENDK
jgi:hypothetical protein